MATPNTTPSPQRRKRVAIVGSGAAGMSSAYALSLSPELFEVTLYERSTYTGGMATSTEIDEATYGGSYINDGVQGASPVFFNTFKLFEEMGFNSQPVGMQVSFGKGDEFWSNVFPSAVIDEFADDIKKFGKVLNIIATFEPVFALISVENMLSLFRFNKRFGEVIVYPLVALFFGTGNQTPFISSAILERVFKDPSMRLFEYSPTSFLATIPSMRAFPRLSLVYETWASVIESTGNVKIKTAHEVMSVVRGTDVKVMVREVEKVGLDQLVVPNGEKQAFEEVFDEIIFACDADAALKLLGKGASWMEKKVLGNVKYLWDVTITHSDVDYMKKYYHIEYEAALASTKRESDAEAQAQFAFAKEGFQPLYFIRSYPTDKKKIEMSFDLTHYQPQFDGETEYGPGGTGKPKPTATLSDVPALPNKAKSTDGSTKSDAKGDKKHVFQTIFLDRDGSRDLWSIDEIKKDEIILTKWWKQQSHRWQHYGGTVPWMMFLNGSQHTHYAGAWSVLNMHEIAIVSGFSAAYAIGAPYPFVADNECKRLFALYLGGAHGKRMRKADRDGFWR